MRKDSHAKINFANYDKGLNGTGEEGENIIGEADKLVSTSL